jgi:flagellar biosynthesis/type III secretory pathway protein FliH
MKKFLAIAAIAVAFASCEEKKADAPATDVAPTTETAAPTTATPDSAALKATADSIAAAAAATTGGKMEAVKGAVTDAVKEGAAKGAEAVKEGVKEAATKAAEAVKK